MIFFKRVFIILFLSSCSSNVFQDLSSKTNDEDFILEAQESLNLQNYDDAIHIVTTFVTADGQTTVAAREVLASAYAGKCGLNFIEYTSALLAQTTGGAFRIMMHPFIGIPVSPENCKTALSTMTLIGPSAARTVNQNAFVSVVGMVLVGSALRGYADIAPANGDGNADVNICTGLTDSQVDDVIVGFGYMSENFAAISSQLVGSTSIGSLDTLISTCSAAVGSSCSTTDPTQIHPLARDTFRDLINTQQFGIGVFNTNGNNALIPVSCL